VTTVTSPCPNTFFTAPLVSHPTAATAGLIPGAEQYYKPYVAPNEQMPSATSDNGPLSAWGDLLERMTRELSTDTMEIANLDNQVCFFVHSTSPHHHGVTNNSAGDLECACFLLCFLPSFCV